MKKLIALFLLICASANAQTITPDQRPHKGIRSQATQLGLGTFAQCINGPSGGVICPGNINDNLPNTTEIDGSAFLGYGVMGNNSIESMSIGIGYFALGTMQGVEGKYAFNHYGTIYNGMLNTAVGLRAMSNSTALGCNSGTAGASLNTASGALSLMNVQCTTGTGGYSNTANGEASLLRITTGYYNTCTGNDCMSTSGSGIDSHDNTIDGAESLRANRGNFNVAVGSQNLQNAVAESADTSIGYGAMQYMLGGGTTSYNTAVGYSALNGNPAVTGNTGTSNTAIGATAIGGNSVLTSGSFNSALGAAALFSATTGSNNVAVGYGAADLVTTGANNTVLGYFVASTTLANGSDNILIGTDSHTDTAASGTSHTLKIEGAGTTPILTATVTNTANPLVAIPGVTTGTNADFACFAAGGVFTLQSTACTISQRKTKENFFALDGATAVADLMELRPLGFNKIQTTPVNADINFALPQYGLIAEDVAGVDPKISIYEDDGVTPKSYRQESLIALLIVGFQKHQNALDGVKAMNDNACRASFSAFGQWFFCK